jgi:hypothetical protein
MSVATYKETVKNSQIKLLIDVKLPEKQASKENLGKPEGREIYV